MTLASGRLRRSLPLLIGILVSVCLIGWWVPTVRYEIQATFTPGSSEQLSILQRLAFALEAIRVWREHPIVGIGFARFEDYADLARLSAGALLRSDYIPGSVHNEYLSTLVKGGILSATTFFVFIFAVLRRHHRLARDRQISPADGRWGIVGLGMASSLLVGGLGGEAFRQISISAPFWILAGGLSIRDWQPSTHRPGPTKASRPT
jgi:O-antigen ligase